MSRQSTQRVIGVLNRGLHERYADGDPIRLDAAGKPQLEVVSFQPLVYNEYGRFRNRAPQLAGSFALRALLSAPHPDGGILIYAGLQAQEQAAVQGYGVALDANNGQLIDVLGNVAEELGLPPLQARAVNPDPFLQ